VEFARALAGSFDLIMLDEPSAGLDSDETAAFGRLLKTVVRARGIGILLVEHDISLVREVCDKTYVLDFGQLIYEGSAEAMASSGAVRSAYLGEEIETAIAEQPELVSLDAVPGLDRGASNRVLLATAGRIPAGAERSNAVASGPPILSLVGISAGYGAVPVLRDVSITVPPASVIAVLGPNGAGKTTLLRVATGLLRSREGQVILGGEDVTALPAYRITQRGMCYIPESRGVFPSLSVRENIILATPKGHEALALDSVRDKFPALVARLSQTAGSLSGGEQQMLSIARAFLQDPKVLAVDEASLGLSPAAIEKVYEALAEILAEGVSLILVEQYVQRALNFADSVHVLSRGRVVYSGRASDLDTDEVLSKYLGND
jgi:ABC-type branched-subunit amino acid transport system ATPase component